MVVSPSPALTHTPHKTNFKLNSVRKILILGGFCEAVKTNKEIGKPAVETYVQFEFPDVYYGNHSS